MWKLVYGSVPGTSHVRSGRPCQDYCSGRGAGGTVIAACADGAGSAELSHVGARLAVECFLEEAARRQADTPVDQVTVLSWVQSARERVIGEASTQGVAPRQLACTFLGALAGDGWAAFVQIGDGVIVFDGDAGYEFAFWPDNGEYVNSTRFLTDKDYMDHVRVEIVSRTLSDLAVLTDGMQMLALDYTRGQTYAPFFEPLFRTVRDGPREEVLGPSLLEFMNSDRVNERTDDDKTLLLATRIAPDVPPNPSDDTV